MTAEVVVMNREGVAIAADSAITIGSGRKILTNGNKVFMLTHDLPIGVLIYNNPNMMEMPWEIILKLYRKDLARKKAVFPSLEEYAEDFFGYIKVNSKTLVGDVQEKSIFSRTIQNKLNVITGKIWEKINKIFFDTGRITDQQIEEIVNETITEYFNALNLLKGLFSQAEDLAFSKKVMAKYRDLINKTVIEIFDQVPLNTEQKKLLIKYCVLLFSKSDWLSFYSGIVFTGYGEQDLFPTCIDYIVEGSLCETLIYTKNAETKIGFSEGEKISAILPFAQDDVIENILSGRHRAFLEKLHSVLNSKLSTDEIASFFTEADNSFYSEYTESIVRTVGILRKDGLASVAQTLVSLTSFMRRVQMDEAESVGGPIDVAVISKKDGFIWIDRKHYFDIDNNLHYNKTFS